MCFWTERGWRDPRSNFPFYLSYFMMRLKKIIVDVNLLRKKTITNPNFWHLCFFGLSANKMNTVILHLMRIARVNSICSYYMPVQFCRIQFCLVLFHSKVYASKFLLCKTPASAKLWLYEDFTWLNCVLMCCYGLGSKESKSEKFHRWLGALMIENSDSVWCF